MPYLAILLTIVLAASDDRAKPVALVLSVEGRVGLRALDVLRPGDLVRVPAAGRVRLVFRVDGHRETLRTAGTVTVTELGCAPAAAVERENARVPKSQLSGLPALDPESLPGAAVPKAFVFELPPSSPINEATVIEDRPDFAWEVIPGAEKYDVQLFRSESDQNTNLVWTVQSGTNQLKYPNGQPALSRAQKYLWTVSVPGKGPVVRGTFTVVSESQTADLRLTRKLAQSQDVADRLLAAVLFEGAGAYDESLRLFADLAKQFPSEPWILLSFSRHLAKLGKSEEAIAVEKKARALAGGPQR